MLVLTSLRRQRVIKRRPSHRDTTGRSVFVNVHARRRVRASWRLDVGPTLRVSVRDTRSIQAIAVLQGRSPQDVVAEAVQRTITENLPDQEVLNPLSEQGYRQVIELLKQPPHANEYLRELLARRR